MGKSYINNLDLAQKIGQVIMPRIDFNDPDSIPRAKRLVEEYKVGGFIIFNGIHDVVAKTTSDLQSMSDIPLLFACDAERGVGQIVSDMSHFPFTMSLGAARDEELVYNQAAFIAQEMKECGLNLIFAPVADVNSNPDNPIINIRSYGDDPELVSNLCSAFIKGCQDNGILACAKHYPGHGSTGVDSHIDLPVLDINTDILKNRDLIPFQSSIEAGVASIMTAHIAFPKIGDGNAVTISKELVSDLLREEMGFKGLIITDSLHMEGIIKLGDEEYLAKEALNAGCDIVLDPQDPITLIENLKDSNLETEQLIPKVKRIFSAKKKINSGRTSKSTNGQILKDKIAKESVCLIRGEALKSQTALVFIFDVTQSGEDISHQFTEQLIQAGINLDKVTVPLDKYEDSIIDSISQDTAIICLLYTSIGAWKKQSLLPDHFKNILDKFGSLPNETVLVSFGSPYIVRGFDQFDTVLCSFDLLDECQTATANVLLGNIKPNGRMPVTPR